MKVKMMKIKGYHGAQNKMMKIRQQHGDQNQMMCKPLIHLEIKNKNKMITFPGQVLQPKIHQDPEEDPKVGLEEILFHNKEKMRKMIKISHICKVVNSQTITNQTMQHWIDIREARVQRLYRNKTRIHLLKRGKVQHITRCLTIDKHLGEFKIQIPKELGLFLRSMHMMLQFQLEERHLVVDLIQQISFREMDKKAGNNQQQVNHLILIETMQKNFKDNCLIS